MSKRSINGTDFTAMVLAGADKLQQHAEHVNSLNVFPVPDGDTGTNMNLTMTAGANELKKNNTTSVGQCAGVLSKGLLMGARGTPVLFCPSCSEVLADLQLNMMS